MACRVRFPVRTRRVTASFGLIRSLVLVCPTWPWPTSTLSDGVTKNPPGSMLKTGAILMFAIQVGVMPTPAWCRKLKYQAAASLLFGAAGGGAGFGGFTAGTWPNASVTPCNSSRSEEHTSELQSPRHL